MTFRVIRLLQVFDRAIFVHLCSICHDFNWSSASRGPSAITEFLVLFPCIETWRVKLCLCTSDAPLALDVCTVDLSLPGPITVVCNFNTVCQLNGPVRPNSSITCLVGWRTGPSSFSLGPHYCLIHVCCINSNTACIPDEHLAVLANTRQSDEDEVPSHRVVQYDASL